MFLDLYTDNYFIIIFLYFFIYNLSVLSIFWLSILFFRSSLVYNFNVLNLNTNIFIKSFLSITFLSLSGLPPFVGFLSKILLITLLSPLNYAYSYIFVFIMFIFFLYFYIQNLKIILSESYHNGQFIFYRGQLKFKNPSILYLILFLFLVLFNILIFDDLLLLIEWVLA